MPTRLEHVQELFEAALARELGDRPAFLAEACGDDVELRTEVETLLEHDSQAGDDFLRPPELPPGVRPADAPDGPDPLIGTKVGNYQIKSVIAAGGMGTVYEAVQEQPERIVALKVMRPYVASRSALRRFQFEAQILGRLRHPNIAQVYEAGTHFVDQSRDREGAVAGGVPYFAMEYIPGAKTVTQYAKDEGLDTRDRLRLFAKACDAVHHGHQKAIIHRDLKPANILVDSTGEPKVIDFGVARATDSDLAITTQQTVAGQLVGTVQYMSPEQCDADPHELDTRSDVYSFGVVLYELLTGELPYDASSSTIYQATRAIKEDEPRRLSLINPKLRGDVETIALKALEKDRERRYESAADLAQDIRRYLNREPIEARPPTAWTRGVRWIARRPLIPTSAACAGIAALIVGGTFLSVRAFNTRPHRIRLDEARTEARLLSFAGGVLHTWIADAPGAIAFAELVKRPDELGAGAVALLAYDALCNPQLRGALCAFDAEGDLEEPLWQRRINTEDVLPELRENRGFVGEQFSIHDCWIFDVFPDLPGREVVAVYGHCERSPRVLRIYNLNGDVLYQVWHDGSMGQCYWMADAGLLVFAGDYHGLYHDRHGNLVGDKVSALVVFAVRLQADVIFTEWMSTTPGHDPRSPAWYLRLMPEVASENVWRIQLRSPPPPNAPGASVWCTLILTDPVSASVAWAIDQSGHEITPTRSPDDAYKINLAEHPPGDPQRLPGPNEFELVPFEASGSTLGESTPDGTSDSSGGEDNGP